MCLFFFFKRIKHRHIFVQASNNFVYFIQENYTVLVYLKAYLKVFVIKGNMELSICNENMFNKVFDTNSEPLRNYLYYQCGDLQQAEDLVQNAFIKLWNNCKKVLYEKARAFLYTVAKNEFYNQVAHKKVVLEYTKKPQRKADFETPEYKIEENEFMEKLQTAINTLPDGQREVFLLNRIDKKTYREIAEMLNISQKAVEKRMHKALVKMRKVVKNI